MSATMYLSGQCVIERYLSATHEKVYKLVAAIDGHSKDTKSISTEKLHRFSLKVIYEGLYSVRS